MSPFLRAVPIFAILIITEWALARWQKRKLFQFEDSIRNLSCGVIEELVAVLSRFLTAGVYVYLFNHHALAKIKPSLGSWFLALIGVDFFYYWFHRASHRVGALWAMHSVHHQSEFYNLTVALRQSAFGGFFSWIFYLPLALIGVPPEMTAAAYALNLLYQFWIHTEVIKTMGWLEGPLNTPSHHRVHHGRNPRYLDKNYAGALICWDKWFGTFTHETEPVDYGVVNRLRSENPVSVNCEGWTNLWNKSKRALTVPQKIYSWVAPPEWEPNSSTQKLELARTPLDRLSPRQRRYVGLNFTATLILGIGYFLMDGQITNPQATVASIWLICSFGSLGAMMNGARWSNRSESLRYFILAGILTWVIL